MFSVSWSERISRIASRSENYPPSYDFHTRLPSLYLNDHLGEWSKFLWGLVFVGLFLLTYKTSHCFGQLWWSALHITCWFTQSEARIEVAVFSWDLRRHFEEHQSWQTAWSIDVRLLTSVTWGLIPKYRRHNVCLCLWICLCFHEWKRCASHVHLSCNADDHERLNFKSCGIFLKVHRRNFFRNNFSYTLDSNSFPLEGTPSWIEDISSLKILLLL